jgi:CubicO group peptidase (beta-lactamase class C family)
MKKENLSRAIKYINSWIDFNFPYSRLPGLVVAIQQGDEIVLEKAWGFADVEHKIPMRPSNMFRIASHSKMFTTVSLLQLVEEGKVQLDKPVALYLPWLAKAKDSRYKRITIEQVLQHGAGVIRDGEDSDYWNLVRPFPTKERLQKDFCNTGLILAPNKHFKYSNYGFSLLGLLIEEVTGVPFFEYIKTHILDPLHMKQSGGDISKEIDLKQFAVGYSREDSHGKRKSFENVSTGAMASATGMYSTATDMCKFGRIFYENNKILTKKSLQLMLKPKWDTSDSKKKGALYGLGCAQAKIGDRYYIGHGGGFPGFATQTVVDVKEKITIVVLTNSIDGEAGVIRAQIAKLLQLFEKQLYSSKAKTRDVYEGRYESVWDVADIINTKDKLISNVPLHWGVSEKPVEYHSLARDVFKIVNANSHDAVGEKAVFVQGKARKVEKLVYAGSTLKRTH